MQMLKSSWNEHPGSKLKSSTLLSGAGWNWALNDHSELLGCIQPAVSPAGFISSVLSQYILTGVKILWPAQKSILKLWNTYAESQTDLHSRANCVRSGLTVLKLQQFKYFLNKENEVLFVAMVYKPLRGMVKNWDCLCLGFDVDCPLFLFQDMAVFKKSGSVCFKHHTRLWALQVLSFSVWHKHYINENLQLPLGLLSSPSL